MTTPADADVLSLVTTHYARFYRKQVDALSERGVSLTTLPVPGQREDASERSALDYLRFYPTVLRRSMDSYDLVHANFGLTAPHAVAQPRLPVVVSLWGTDLFGPYGWVSERSVPHADAVIVMSEEMAAALDCECHVIPHGVDTELFRPQPREAARRTVGWAPAEKHVLFPYSVDRTVKNYPLAARVVERVDDRMDETVNLQTVTGLAHDEIPAYMNAADALLLTSEWEGSPNSVKEAMACNLPVVSRAVGDVPERLDGVAPSAVCDSDDELVDALADVLRTGGRSNGREAIRRLTDERMADRILDVYESVL